jgi:hypothetical protein
MPQLDALEVSFLSFIAAFVVYVFIFWFPEDDMDEEDEVELSYLGLRVIQYFELLRACILFYNLGYYGLSFSLVKNFKLSLHNNFILFVFFYSRALDT